MLILTKFPHLTKHQSKGGWGIAITFFLNCTKLKQQQQQPYDGQMIESADKHQQKAAHEGKKLEPCDRIS